MKKLFIIFITFLGIANATSSWAKLEIRSGSILEKGVYGDLTDGNACKIGRKIENPIDNKNDLGCLITDAAVFNLIENTRIGIKYLLKGAPEGFVELEFRVKNMETSVAYVTKIRKRSIRGKIKGIFGFSFNQSVLMIPGVWSIGIYNKGELVLATTYRATPN